MMQSARIVDDCAIRIFSSSPGQAKHIFVHTSIPASPRHRARPIAGSIMVPPYGLTAAVRLNIRVE
jgi:hypothetical protein